MATLHAEPRAPYPNAREVLAAHRAPPPSSALARRRAPQLVRRAGQDRTPTGPRCAPPPPRGPPPAAGNRARDEGRRPAARLPSLALRTALGAHEWRVAICVRCRGAAHRPPPAVAARCQARCVSRPDRRAEPATGRCGWRCRLWPRRGEDCRWCGALATRWRCARRGDRLRVIATGATAPPETGRAFGPGSR